MDTPNPQFDLVTLAEVPQVLDARLSALGIDIEGYHLREHVTSPAKIDATEERLGVRLPRDFREVLSRYDLGNLTIGRVTFGYEADYLELLERMNIAREDCWPWWGDGDRPTKLLLIAGCDPYMVLIDVRAGAVLAYDPDAPEPKLMIAAQDFVAFLRGLATGFALSVPKTDNQTLAERIADAVGAGEREFWVRILS